ncbi:MAG: DUF72 domain-containing protein [Candidatus Acidiferrales bacterium]
MRKVYAGTSGWAYASWKPKFYPAKLSADRFLNYYASRLNSVEVNYTFRRIPSADLLQRWADATPKEFRFAMKAPQAITHIKRLRDAAATTKDFLDSLEPLRKMKKLGPVLFQLPPNFKCDVARLREFLAVLPRGLRAAFEFRHESWFVEEVYAALRKAGVALCLAESEDLVTPNIETANFCYLRLRKESYSAKSAAQRVLRLARRGDVFAYFKHEESPEGALNAEAVLAATKKD